MDYVYHYASPLGGITLGSNGNALIGLWFDGQKYYADTLDRNSHEMKLPIFEETVRWLDIYFSGHAPDFTPQLRLRTTDFRRIIAGIMLTIPFGGTMTYGQIAAEAARQLGLPHMSAQAVGSAVSHNAISLIIPCHRVIGSDSSLTGYAGGIERKARLLSLEKGLTESP